MQITLNQEEILEALDGYVRERIAIAENQEVTIDMKAGRSENGFTATLNIIPRVGVAPAPATHVTMTRTAVENTDQVHIKPAAAAPSEAQASKNPFAKIAEEAPVAKATPFPNRRAKVEAEATAAVIQTTTAADPEPEPDVAQSEYADTVDVVDPDEDNAVAEPVEAEPEVAPVKRSIFSKAG